jgi:predicted acetyltransferase
MLLCGLRTREGVAWHNLAKYMDAEKLSDFRSKVESDPSGYILADSLGLRLVPSAYIISNSVIA